jgi:hypothetical protein
MLDFRCLLESSETWSRWDIRGEAISPGLRLVMEQAYQTGNRRKQETSERPAPSRPAVSADRESLSTD